MVHHTPVYPFTPSLSDSSNRLHCEQWILHNWSALEALWDSHRLNVLCLPQTTVQKWSWAASSAAFTTWFSSFLRPVRGPPTAAAPATHTWRPRWSRLRAVTTTPALTWTAGCSAPARMQATVWSWPWRFLKSVIISTSGNGGKTQFPRSSNIPICMLACNV